MPESERVAVLRDAYEAYNRGGPESVLHLLDADVEWHPPESSLEPEPLHGLEAVREYLSPNLFDQQRAEPDEFIEHGDRILVRARATARGAGSGIELDQTVFHLWTLKGERVVRFQVYGEREQAMAALTAKPDKGAFHKPAGG